MKRIFSGIQPTGNLHLGNYLGAIKNWVHLQHSYESFFCIVDSHAITIDQDPALLKQHNLEIAALYLACGIDPDKSTIFVQSDVSAHAELMWILACHTPLGWLNRMTQYKDKSKLNKNNEKLGLFSYPVLMAADILLYQTDCVPVGEDQKQHLELTRDLAMSLNQKFSEPLFAVPEPLISKQAARVMSLRDGTKKMSKSDPAEGSRIHIADTPEVIHSKIKKAKTDALPFPSSKKELENRPDITNLMGIYQAFTQQSLENIFKEFGGGNFSPFKTQLAEACIQELSPIQEKYKELMRDKETLHKLLEKGAHHAQTCANKTLKRVKTQMGLGA